MIIRENENLSDRHYILYALKESHEVLVYVVNKGAVLIELQPNALTNMPKQTSS